MVPKILVVVPVFNESRKIVEVISSLKANSYTYIVINDGSIDETKTVLTENKIHNISLAENKGQGAALREGFKYALENDFDICVHFDGDGQHQVHDISKIIKPIVDSEKDIVFGSRFMDKKYIKNIPFAKRIILRMARIFEGFRTGIWLSDAHCGLRALKISSCFNMQLNANGMAHASEILTETKRLNLKYTEVPVNIIYHENTEHESIFKRIISILKELYFKK